jgi:hypothetical protein
LTSDNLNISDGPDQRKSFFAIPLCALIFRGFSPTAKEEIMLPISNRPAESASIPNTWVALVASQQLTEAEFMAETHRAYSRREMITEAEMMAQAGRTLDKSQLIAPAMRAALIAPAPPPKHYTPEQQERRMRSLRKCHRPSLYERPRHTPPKDTGAYVPAISARLDNDRNLTDGARRCARKIMEETHRRDRKECKLLVNVSYLAKGLGRCRRTIQRYLAVLEREGYLRVEVMSGHRSRMCIGLIVHLLEPLFPRHQRKSWPQKAGNPPKNLTDDAENRRNPDATSKSQNKIHSCFKEEEIDPLLRVQPYINSYHPRFRALHYGPDCSLYSRNVWAEKCMAGVFRALLKAVPGLHHDHFASKESQGLA